MKVMHAHFSKKKKTANVKQLQIIHNLPARETHSYFDAYSYGF
jgi:hypothetical protein